MANQMRRLSRFLMALAWLAVLLALPATVHADISPPPPKAPGANPEPGSELTQVRMVYETVVIDVPVADPPKAHITAVFTMRNLGSKPENMAVRFPIATISDFTDSGYQYSESKNVSIKVNQKTVTYRRIQGPEPIFGKEGQLVPWVEFDASFPVGEDVNIKVSYDLDGEGYVWNAMTSFYYILSTGAGWNGTIGLAKIILRLPYEADLQNVIFNSEERKTATHFSGQEVDWTYTNFEPDLSYDQSFNIIKPSVWNQVIIERDNTTRNPNDVQAWGRLGKAYKEAYFTDYEGFARTDQGAAPLFEWGKQAYEKAVTLLPNDGQLHAGYVDLFLLILQAHDFRQEGPELSAEDYNRILIEMQRALELAPNDPVVQQVADRAGYDFNGQVSKGTDGLYVFNTATPVATPQPTGTPLPTLTAPPPLQPATAAPATPAPKSSSPICGGAALVLVPVALIAWKTRKSRSG
jgi:hypothetical protein